MWTTLPVSCFIIVKNEADRIARTVHSVRDWADEVIVVVDSGSKDSTQVARELGATVVENTWLGHGSQKRFAEDLCRNEWLLNLNAGETITLGLAEEIRQLFANGNPAADRYRIFIAETFSFEEKPSFWSHGRWQIRLYNRRKGRFADSPVHDTIRPVAGARIMKLKGSIEHAPNPPISLTNRKMNCYSDALVADMRARKRQGSRLRLVVEFPLAFLRAYFLRRYFLRGFWGWTSAINYAFFRHLAVAKAYEAELFAKAGRECAEVQEVPANLLVVSGFSGAGKSTFIQQLRRGTLPSDIRSHLPEQSHIWGEISAENARGRGGTLSAPASGSVSASSGLILHYPIDQFQRMSIRPYELDPAFNLVSRIERIVVVVISISSEQLVTQFTARATDEGKQRGGPRALPWKLLKALVSSRRRRDNLPPRQSLFLNNSWCEACFRDWEGFVRSTLKDRVNSEIVYVTPTLIPTIGPSFSLIDTSRASRAPSA